MEPERGTSPTKLGSFEDMLALYPGLVTEIALGEESDWGEVQYLTLQQGQPHLLRACAHPANRLRLISFQQATTVGRHCSILGPENRLVADLGYFLPHTEPENLSWTRWLNVKFWRSRWLVDLRYRQTLPGVRRIVGTVAVLNNPWCHNYYHWLLEVAPRAMMLREAGIEPDWYVVDCWSGYQKRALQLMGISMDRCIQPHYGLHLQADTLYRPSFPGHRHCQMMAEAIKSNLADDTQPKSSRRIYISRKTAAHRKVSNEPALEKLLSQYGFKSYSFDRLAFDEQVRLVQSAESIVTVHGAALANLIFARPHTKVIEICPIDRYNSDCFPRLSQKVGHQHLLVMAPSTRHRQNLTVDLKDIELALKHHGINQTGSASPRVTDGYGKLNGEARSEPTPPEL